MEPFIEPAERLFVPYRKRLFHSYAVNDQGTRELRLYYGMKEVVFDDERYFAFGEQLVTEPSFTGQRATTWGPGYAWDELRPFLEALLEEGILQRGESAEDPRGSGLVPSPLSPSVCSAPRWWSLAECEAITRDLANRAVELGNLEAVIPAYRIAHMALDADGRQVGEAKVFPARLRLDCETEWRVCQYSGSRFRDDTPMNVTALKAMIKHWKPMMATILRVRAALRERLGPSRGPSPESWRIGELHVLSCVVLALPAFQLVKHGGSSPPPLHPVLSSLFRITDGIRMTTSQMMFSIEHTRPADEPVTADELYLRAEQHGLLLSGTGVCAGPKHLIDEFLCTVVDGAPAKGIEGLVLPAEVGELMSELPAAVEYGLRGFQMWNLSFSVWLAMSRAYQELLAILEPAAADDERCARLCARLGADRRPLEKLQIALDHERGVHLTGYADGYERSWRAQRTPAGPSTLAQAISPAPESAMHRAAAHLLRERLRAGLARVEHAPDVDRIVDALIRYLREEQAILTVAAEIQASINGLLDRSPAARELTVRDFQVFYSLHDGPGSFPYVFDALEDELGIHVECTARAVAISDRRPA
ncbi:MAG TPA: hypothetical protein VF469_21495 [Kofleriaceae bacterium]